MKKNRLNVLLIILVSAGYLFMTAIGGYLLFGFGSLVYDVLGNAVTAVNTSQMRFVMVIVILLGLHTIYTGVVKASYWSRVYGEDYTYYKE
ncbi:hypothetical protein [Sinobaca qinghaiensis]|uniref:hypothetical protein n=1 Tax=Sinobaca qinghaiensis TaxID=342944 RepID=UPI0011C4A3A7|nr:hypothetical protein [Sinobaca qinghaiensis]